MVGFGSRGRAAKEPVHACKEERSKTEDGPGAVAGSRQGIEEEGQVEEEHTSHFGIRFKISPRKFRIDPNKKRTEYIRRLEGVMNKCDRLLANPSSFKLLQVKAMNVLIRAIKTSYGLVYDIDIELLEIEVEELKKREQQLDKELSYTIKEDP